MKTFADRLTYAMTNAGMNQAELSEVSGCSRASVSQYLAGKNTPGPQKVQRLAEATNTTFDFLMGFSDAPADPAPIPAKRITVKAAARCLGKSEQFVRIGLQRGLLPFGLAVPGTGENWNYDIRPEKFRDYVGVDRFNEFFHLTA